MARQRISSPRGFDQDLRPKQAGFDVDRGDFGDADADLVLADPRAFAPDYGFIRHLNVRGEEQIAASQAAGTKDFRWHS